MDDADATPHLIHL